ncbi:MAG: hypothetical protein J6B23_02195 [Clostridia bacterium]|nr:hypothetical protein [Clostridia bacterium]
MADDIGEKLQALLSNPEAMNMFSSLLGSGNNKGNETDNSGNDEFINNIQTAMSKLSNTSDRRINLLNALRPYMRSSRAEGIDKAVKMLKLTQLTSIFKDL